MCIHTCMRVYVCVCMCVSLSKSRKPENQPWNVKKCHDREKWTRGQKFMILVLAPPLTIWVTLALGFMSVRQRWTRLGLVPTGTARIQWYNLQRGTSFVNISMFWLGALENASSVEIPGKFASVSSALLDFLLEKKKKKKCVLCEPGFRSPRLP